MVLAQQSNERLEASYRNWTLSRGMIQHLTSDELSTQLRKLKPKTF